MKLELKHIVGYLPYQTKFICTRNRISVLDTYIGICAGKNIIDIGYVINNNLKPILRPLSDLKDLDAIIFYKFDKIDLELIDIHEWTEELINMIKGKDKFTLEQFEKLYEMHFDIHGLIEKGSAIDINTLKP